jgi:hypothetical protein
MSDHIRIQPIARYRIVTRHGGGQATIEYADDRESALQHQADVGGIVEVYIPGIGWEKIIKVAEADE